MKHGIRKFKLQLGHDANRMTMRKLAKNFFSHGALVTTEKKAKQLKIHVERLVEKTKERSEANKNFLLRNLADQKLVQQLFTHVGTAFADRVGGYVRLQKLHERESDSALMMRLEWTVPVVMEEKAKPEKTVKKIAPVTKTKKA